MKHLILATAFIAAIFTSAFAGERPSKAENDAAMKAGRIQLASKISDLEVNLKNHNTQAAQGAATDVLKLMRSGMSQINNDLYVKTEEEQKVSYKHYNDMESIIYQYMSLSKDVPANGLQLLDHARMFMKRY